MAQGRAAPSGLTTAGNAAGWICAGLLALLFLVAGLWKLSDPMSAAQRMVQALIPRELSLATALGAGIVETLGGVLLLVPRWRRWGALLTGLMLIAFMFHIGANYSRLQGEECNCFPWVKRAVGPAFFIGDAVMLLFALGAWWWARPAEGWKHALLALGAIGVFAGVLFGVSSLRASGIQAPAEVTVEGKAFPLHEGRVFLYFFDPECAHCDQAARAMAGFHWKDVKLLTAATRVPQYGPAFLRDTRFAAALTGDVDKLRAVFAFTDPPYGVALEDGRQVKAFPFFDDKEPAAGLRQLGFIE